MIEPERFIVIGQYSDNSGTSDEVFGPYPKEVAEEVSQFLASGNHGYMNWKPLPVRFLPGVGPNPFRRSGA